MLLAMAVSGLCLQIPAGAQENAQSQPSYSNAATAAQAAEMAKRGAHAENPSLQAAMVQLHDAENRLGQMQSSGDQHQQMAAEMALNRAEDSYIGMVSQMSGVSAMEISDMHAAGVDWADIPGELGMQAMAGLTMNKGQGSMTAGSMMGSRQTEVMMATARNTRSGMAKGHGTGMHTGVHSSSGMMTGSAGLGSGMGSGDMGSHSGGMSGGGSGSGGGGGMH